MKLAIKTILISLFWVNLSYAQQAGTYYVIMDPTTGFVLNVHSVNGSTPNANEQRLFKIVKVDFINETEYYDFVNAVLEPQLDVNNNFVPGGSERKNKIDTITITGKGEKVGIQDIKNKLVTFDAVITADNFVP